MQHSRYIPRAVHLRSVMAVLAFAAVTTPVAQAQGFLQKLAGAAADVAMRNAPAVDLESSGLPTLAMGELQLGVSRIAVKDSVGVRLQAYLYNPGAEAVSVPVPDRALFALVDERGRRLSLVIAPRIERHQGNGPVSVPALERVAVVLQFGGPAADAQHATLKVGAVGMITGIPLRGGAAGTPNAAGAGGGNVWTAPAAPPPMPPDTTARRSTQR